MNQAWKLLLQEIAPQAKNFLPSMHQQGFANLALDENTPPNLTELTEKIKKNTGWELIPAEGEMPATHFFKALAQKKFPLVYSLREPNTLFASAIPDLWHELFGHIPFLAYAPISELYQLLGQEILKAEQANDHERQAWLTKIYWYVCEYGVLKTEQGFKMLGAGMIASPLGHFMLRPNAEVNLKPLTQRNLKKAEFNPYQYQKNIFYVESVESVFSLID
jgi:phenylalanine-4-hydroxylase